MWTAVLILVILVVLVLLGLRIYGLGKDVERIRGERESALVVVAEQRVALERREASIADLTEECERRLLLLKEYGGPDALAAAFDAELNG